MNSKLWWVVALSAALYVVGCGDDDDGGGGKNESDSGTRDASTAGSGGSAPSPGITPLDDGVAGRECSSSDDCGGAMCATQIPGGALLPVMAPGGYCTGTCVTNADCGADGACVGAVQGFSNGQCFATCTVDADCRDGYLCAAGGSLLGITVPNTCRPKPQTDQLEDDTAGDECTSASDCPGGQCLTMRGAFGGLGDMVGLGGMGATPLPGGYCGGNCLEDSHCGAGGVCAPSLIPNLAGACYQECTSDADCTRDGYRCRQVGQGVMGCNPFPDPLPDDTAGKACTSDADCGGGAETCATSLPMAGFGGQFGQGETAPGGYCTQRCANADDCGAGGTCVGAGIVDGRCFETCTADADCRTGYTCEERGGNQIPGLGGGGDAGMSMTATVCAPQPAPDTDGGS